MSRLFCAFMPLRTLFTPKRESCRVFSLAYSSLVRPLRVLKTHIIEYMSNRLEKRRFLCLCDASYVQYFMIFGAVSEFQRRYEDEAGLWIKPVEECDQENLPNLVNCATFRRVLKSYVAKRLESIENIVKANFQDVVDSCDEIDVVFACDDSLKRNFRLDAYPQYKANRLLVKRQYQLAPIKDYIRNVLYKELGLEDQYGYKFVQVEGAEGDDVIAAALTRFRDRYAGMCLIASDRDFLQIDGVREFDLFGKESKRELAGEEVSAADFLLGKILMGDKSDNIKQVFSRCGPKTALSLIRNKDELRRMLKEDASAAARYELNKKIISFEETPKDLVDAVEKKLNEAFYSEEPLNSATDLRSFMDW